MTFRHPLRNEFDQVKDQLERDAKKPGAEGSQARAMLAIVPGFIDWLEAERDLGSAPLHRVEGMRAVVGNIARQAVKTAGTQLGSDQTTLERFLVLIARDVGARLKPQSKLILPGLPG